MAPVTHLKIALNKLFSKPVTGEGNHPATHFQNCCKTLKVWNSSIEGGISG
jgi:hypothetical protein